MYSCFHCIHLYPYEIEMFMYAHTYMHTSKRGKVDKDGVTMDLIYCFEYEQSNAFHEILLIILKERPITLIPTIFPCFLFCFFFKNYVI